MPPAGRPRLSRLSRLARLGVVAALFIAAPADSFVPRSERVVDAVAKANKKAHRTAALRVEITLKIDDGDVVASGELISHPTGLARLELRTPSGLVERHLLLGTEHRAARNGNPLAAPRAFVPPIFFMQANRGSVLDAALEQFGVASEEIGLAPCAQGDCFVLGDPAYSTVRETVDVERAVTFTRVEPAPGAGTDPPEASAAAFDAPDPADDPDGFDVEADDLDDSQDPVLAEEIVEITINENAFASIWIDSEDFHLVKIRSTEGVEVSFGPVIAFGKRLRFPEWWTIAEEGKPIVRFDVVEVGSVTAPGRAFDEAWMLAPATPSDSAPEPENPATP